MKLSHRSTILFSGFLYLAIGTLLLTKGINYLVEAGHAHMNGALRGFSLLKYLDTYTHNGEKSQFILVTSALILGVFKGRVALRKAANRVVGRIRSLPSPIPFSAIYSKGYLFLVGGMALLGISFKYLPFPLDVKGFVDLTVGVALINGAMLYFRESFRASHTVA